MSKCKRCGGDKATIQTAEDSHYRIVKCPECGWWCWLKWYAIDKKF